MGKLTDLVNITYLQIADSCVIKSAFQLRAGFNRKTTYL